MMNCFNLVEEYEYRLKDRKRQWHQFFEIFNKPSNEPSSYIDELMESYKTESPVASVQNAVPVYQEQIVLRSCLRNKSRKLFSRRRLNSMETTEYDNNKGNFNKTLTKCVADVNVDNTDFFRKLQCEVKLINVLGDIKLVLSVLRQCKVCLNRIDFTGIKPREEIINNVNIMKEKKRHGAANSNINEVQEITSDNYFGDITYASKTLANNFHKFNEVEVNVSKEQDNTEEHISKKVKRLHTTNNSNECVKNANETLIKMGSREEYLQYINEFHTHEANPDDFIAKIKLMTQCTRGKYKRAMFVLIFLKRNRKQMTVDYTIACQSRDDHLKIMMKNFSHSDISLYNNYLKWLYDKRRKL